MDGLNERGIPCQAEMRRDRSLKIASAGAAVAVVALAGAYAARASTLQQRGSHVLDSTYACRVQAQHYIDVSAGVTLASFQGMPRPAQVWLDTAGKTKQATNSAGITYQQAQPQVWFQAVKNSLTVDRQACGRSSRRVPLEPAGLASDGTVTPAFRGSDVARCAIPKGIERVLVHFRVTMNNATPERALVAIRSDDARHRPVAFIRWSPRAVTAYLADSCSTS